jgi:hypothetical protein
VAQDMSALDGLKEKEVERKALEQNALAEFLAGQGIQMEQPAASSEPAQKEIGPQSEPQKN